MPRGPAKPEDISKIASEKLPYKLKDPQVPYLVLNLLLQLYTHSLVFK